MSLPSQNGAVGRRGCQLGVLLALAAASASGFIFHSVLAVPALADDVQYTKPISNRLNVTGRAIDLPVVLKDGDRPLGDVIIRIGPDDTVMVHKASLAEKLASCISASERARLEAIQANNAVVTMSALVAAGFQIRFDSALQELVFHPAVDQRPIGDIRLGLQTTPLISKNLARPALMAGYVNVTAGVDHIWAGTPLVGQSRTDDATVGRLEFDSAVRLWNAVIENRVVYKSSAEPNTCPAAVSCLYDETPGFKRQSTRIVYDQPDRNLRFQAGDVDPLGLGIQGARDVLGVSLEKSPQKLNPAETARPTGRSSFRIERVSQVEILVNGVVLQRLQLRPGIYNIRDLPLATGANDIQLDITDDSGDKRTQHFTIFFDGSLLAAGKDEWGLSAGVPSYVLNDQRFYSDNQYMGTAYYRYGLTNDVTIEAHAQADNYVAMAGGGAIMQTPWGVFGLRGALSGGEIGLGSSVVFDWSLVNFSGLTGARGENFRVSFEYRSPDFRVPGEIIVTADNLPYLRPNYHLRFDASYSLPIGLGISATIAGRYLMVDAQQVLNAPFPLQGDRYGADVTLSRSLGPTMSGSFTLGYSNESYFHSFYGNRSDGAEFRIAARLYFRPDEKTTIAAGYDTLNKQADISAYRSEGNGIGRWDVSVQAQGYEVDDRAAIGGAASYTGNRAEVRAAHSAGFTTDGFGNSVAQRTSVRVGSSIAFADGRIAVGPPIRSGAFAIVYPHESIATKEITVGNSKDIRAKADAWGPAVVTSIPAYQPSTIPVDADDLPVGYSLGAAAFDTYAPYKAGYSLEVGSAYSVYAYGTLQFANGEPVALLTGIARPIDGPVKQVPIFTNAAGRFGAEGLGPGKWIIEMATPDRLTTFQIDIPAGTDGLFKTGILNPLG